MFWWRSEESQTLHSQLWLNQLLDIFHYYFVAYVYVLENFLAKKMAGNFTVTPGSHRACPRNSPRKRFGPFESSYLLQAGVWCQASYQTLTKTVNKRIYRCVCLILYVYQWRMQTGQWLLFLWRFCGGIFIFCSSSPCNRTSPEAPQQSSSGLSVCHTHWDVWLWNIQALNTVTCLLWQQAGKGCCPQGAVPFSTGHCRCERGCAWRLVSLMKDRLHFGVCTKLFMISSLNI